MIKTVCKIQQCRSSRSSEPSTSARSSWRRHNGRNLTATSFHLPCTADLCILGSTKSSILPIPSISPSLPIPSRSIRQNSYFWSKSIIFSPYCPFLALFSPFLTLLARWEKFFQDHTFPAGGGGSDPPNSTKFYRQKRFSDKQYLTCPNIIAYMYII